MVRLKSQKLKIEKNILIFLMDKLLFKVSNQITF